MSMKRLDELVQRYLDKLEWEHPVLRSEKFLQNSMAKWACREILRDIYSLEDLPFSIAPVELLNNFVDRMNDYALNHNGKEASYRFSLAADTGEYLIEEYYRQERNAK